MGATDAKGICETCKQGYAFCPGHFGRVELPVPVYNPLTFGTVVRLLRCTCLHCWHFRLNGETTAKCCTKMALLAAGHLAEGMDCSVFHKPEKGEEDSDVEALGDEEADEKAAAPAAPAAMESNQPQWTTHTWGEARRLVAQFLAKQPAKCENCGCASPALKAEGSSKVFRAALSGKARNSNLAKGVDVDKELLALARAAVSDEQLEAALLLQRDAEKEAEEEAEEEEEDGESSGEDGLPPLATKRGAERGGKRTQAAKGSGAGLAQGAQGEKSSSRLVTPVEALAWLRKLWEQEGAWINLCWLSAPGLPPGGHSAPGPAAAVPGSGPERLFLSMVLVPPNKFRPASQMDGMTFEHPQNAKFVALIKAIANFNDSVKGIVPVRAAPRRSSAAATAAAAAVAAAAAAAPPMSPQQRADAAIRAWLAIQDAANSIIDSAAASGLSKAARGGIRQELERKEGLFRMHMMGKRVNYAARSVISPDPYIAPGEVGVPPFIARRLTITETVTPFNVAALRKAVENGADEYPGAAAVEGEDGRVTSLATMKRSQREALAKTLLASDHAASAPTELREQGRPTISVKSVYRHMRDGDIMLTNRQPTLHKPGVMAHRARVLAGQRTIRLHYSNCATFNADFDGDEINLHLPQDDMGRAEARGIVAADCQFTVPTDGKPIRGLIQDHIVSAVLLTKRDTFLEREEFSNLLYFASLSLPGGCPPASALGPSRLTILPGGLRLQMPQPAVLKPRRLWTGKQLMSSLLALLASGRPPLTCEAKTKVPDAYFGAGSSEDVLFVHRGDFVHGVFDKNAFAKFGLLHAVQELYGNSDAGAYLSALSRLFTNYLQAIHGFSCGLDDMLLRPAAEAVRAAKLGESMDASRRAAEEFAFAGIAPVGDVLRPAPAVREQLEGRLRERDGAEAGLDMKTTGPLSKITSAVIKECLPKGQVKPFPYNYLSLMTVSGAKGGPVNFAQISALLGQQELEGRRVPRMPSGKTLPCFVPFDLSARAGGYIADRFLTGIRPQEYYFHWCDFSFLPQLALPGVPLSLPSCVFTPRCAAAAWPAVRAWWTLQ